MWTRYWTQSEHFNKTVLGWIYIFHCQINYLQVWFQAPEKIDSPSYEKKI
tara:strand:+ start:116 stop:265 length:150 start_codon:yes stop_codon:yes gene_type:complete